MNGKQLNLTKDHEDSDKRKFVAQVGYIFTEEDEDHKPKGYYFRLSGVKKVRTQRKKNKGILNLGETIVQFSTEDHMSEDIIPPSASKVMRAKMESTIPQNAEGKAKKFTQKHIKLIMKEWISHLILEEDYEFLGLIEEAKQGPDAEPETIRFNIAEQ